METHTLYSFNLSDLCGVNTQQAQIIRILVIDEIPLLSVGLYEVFRSIHSGIQLDYSDNIFRALSSRQYEDRDFDLVILGSDGEHSSSTLLPHAASLKQRFPGSRVMIYTDLYDPEVITQTTMGTVDACVHKHEPAEEIRKAYVILSSGKTYVSAIFDTLYYSYRLDR
ncbi:MAG: response regulator transcription factor [Bacteroidetes bacterium]|nr:response regulator transcription factor [Bacteroidota bacterium]